MMANEPFDGKKDRTSDFNEAKYQILRLHLLWQSCNTLSQNGQLVKWKWKLDAIWRELAADAKEKNELLLYEKNKLLNNKIAFNKDEEDKLYLSLQDKEIFLRTLQESVGKGSKKRFTDEDDFDD